MSAGDILAENKRLREALGQCLTEPGALFWTSPSQVNAARRIRYIDGIARAALAGCDAETPQGTPVFSCWPDAKHAARAISKGGERRVYIMLANGGFQVVYTDGEDVPQFEYISEFINGVEQ